MQRAILPFLAAAALFGQTPDARPAFEAASVKVNNTGATGSSSNGSTGQVVMNNQTLHRLIERAYSVKPLQVSGPGWIESVHFDIAAKYPAGAKTEDRPAMLRTLLEDRFKLAVHRETKDMPGYVLVLAKGGLKLKPVEHGNDGTSSKGGIVRELTATALSMEQLADFATRELGAMVLDKTGADGVYSFQLRWTNAEQDAPDGVPSFAAALQETVGVRLQPQKVPVEMIVVDHAERAPIEN